MRSTSLPLPPSVARGTPTTDDILRVWRKDRCIGAPSAEHYLQWIQRLRRYWAQRGLDEPSELTLVGVRRFIACYRRHRGRGPLSAGHQDGARSAVLALRRVYQVMELPLPGWKPAPKSPVPTSRLLRGYAEHLAQHRGNPEVTVRKKLAHIGMLLQYLAKSGKTWRRLTLPDIDEFLIGCARRFARPTTADIAGSVRSFARFLLATGRLDVDLAAAVISPVRRQYERPRRAFPWDEVQRLLRAVDTSSARGLRDHALLLMMSTYGLGAGEVIGLQLHDIDWEAATVKVTRAKTRTSFMLPLLPAVARVLARYLRQGRPAHTRTRHLFVRMKLPFEPLVASSAVRHILEKHAKAAGIDAPFLGSHVLRHANAARQLDAGTPPRVLSALLGHRDAASLSAYVRIAPHSLREVSLPVPR